MSSTDVIVVGGGPSGSVTAISIAKKGFKVTIIEKKQLDKIGDKTCGDAVDKAAVMRVKEGIGIDLPHGDEVKDVITKMSIAVEDIDKKITLDAPGFLVDRHIYGQRLIKTAQELGVEIIDQAIVRELIIEEIEGEKYVSGVKYLKEGTHEIRSQFVIDASGAYAVVRKALPEDMLYGGLKHNLNPDEQWPTYREIIELQQPHKYPNEIILKYDVDYPPPGYFWLFSKGPKQLNVGIGWAKNQKLGPMREMYLKEMEKYYPRDSYSIINQGGGQIPFRIPFDNLVFNGGAVVGDAACMVHPVTAEGHGPALDTAWRLGNVIVDALNSGDRSINQLWRYNVEISKHYGRKHTEAEIFREMIEKVGVSGLKFLFESNVFKEEELNLVFSGGTLDLNLIDQLKRVLKLMRKPSLLFTLKSVFGKINACKQIFEQYPTDPSGIQKWRRLRNEQLKMNY
ncbi:MAG: NAD(P)/FAD-dependent oxidoreductase [Candidatus Heimdallarchaeota archaeon]|nr:NAD(P)/FAD-dependent oxidoreductase [Candidatus Heimdallarchaeota archaeon]